MTRGALLHARRAAAATEAFLASTTREVHRSCARSTASALPAAPASADAAGRRAAIHARIAAAAASALTACASSPSSGTARSSSRPRPSPRPLRAAPRGAARPHRPALRRRALVGLLRRARASRRPSTSWGSAAARTPQQTARMLAALEPLLADAAPDAVLVYGDTNSTLAGALAAAQAQVPVAHVEAGMRSFDRAMPEELNRVVTDHLARCCCAHRRPPSTNLRRESRRGRGRARRRRDGRRRAARPPARAGRRGPAARRRRAGRRVPARDRAPRRQRRRPGAPARARRRCCSRCRCRSSCRCIRVRARAWRRPASSRRSRRRAHARSLPPLGYLAFTSLLARARAVLTDSGGVQKEAYLAGVPCVTLRDTTEWVETVDAGWNVLVDLDAEAALAALERSRPPTPAALRRRAGGRARRRRARGARGLTPQASRTADAPQRHAGRGEARGVEHAAPVDDRARAGQVAGRQRACTRRGRPAGSPRRRRRRPTARSRAPRSSPPS